jgi:eukaryotic-like serine/threonine-protein kinase
MNDDLRSTLAQATDPFIGLSVANLFQIDALVGTGAASHVYRATQVDVGRSVAIKIMHRTFLASKEMRARFHREARISSQIVHPAVVPVLMTGELPDCEPTQGEAFIVYDFVDGVTLRAVMETGNLPSLPEIMGIVVTTAEAVGAAHELGIIHRDLKPENLMIVRGEHGSTQVRVLDFGLAKQFESTEVPLTHTGAILGTPNYLSPEGARGCAATARSDVYSLAIIAYECLAGHPPFVGTSPIGVLMQQIESVPPPLQRAAGLAEVPPLIARTIMENLAKSPAQRAANALEFARSLRRAADASQVPIENCGPDCALWQAVCALKSTAPSDQLQAAPDTTGERRP